MQSHKPILLIEGSAADLPVVKHALDDLGSGDQVIYLTTTSETLVYLQTQTERWPAVVLLCLDESCGDGLATLRAIKDDARLRVIPVVVLGPSGESHTIEESFRLGAAGYLAKSPDPRELCETLRMLYEYWSLSELPKQA